MTTEPLGEDVRLEPTDPSILDKYGVLLRNLKKFFPTVENPLDRSDEFILEYRTEGENDIRFDGLADQIKIAVKNPIEFSSALNYTMDYVLTPDETREYMIDLYNRLTKKDDTLIKAKEDPQELMSYYTTKNVKVPFGKEIPYFGSSVPLWGLALISLALATIGWLGYTFLNFPVIGMLFFLILVIGVLGLLYSTLTMFFLRDEVVNADRYEERREALENYKEAKKLKKQTSKIRKPFKR